ncbi:unnamed protein product, partial [Porites lobata]
VGLVLDPSRHTLRGSFFGPQLHQEKVDNKAALEKDKEFPRFCLTEMNKSRRNSAALFDRSLRFRTPLPLGLLVRNQVQKSSAHLFALMAYAAA